MKDLITETEGMVQPVNENVMSTVSKAADRSNKRVFVLFCVQLLFFFYLEYDFYNKIIK